MNRYVYCDRVISTNIRIPELPASDDTRTGISFTLQTAKAQTTVEPWLHHWLSPNGARLLSYRKEGSQHVLRFPGLADFRLSADALQVSCFPVPGTPRETLRHLLIDQVIPRCLAHKGQLMLHASAVVLDPEAILFVGESQSGKSTLAGDFHRAGYPLASDDVVLLKQIRGRTRVTPSYLGLRLWEDSRRFLFPRQVGHPMAHYSSKKRIAVDGHRVGGSREGIPVQAVIVLPLPNLPSQSEIRLSKLALREAFMVLQKQSFALSPDTPVKLARHMQVLGRIVPQLPVYRLTMPRDYRYLAAAREYILQQIAR